MIDVRDNKIVFLLADGIQIAIESPWSGEPAPLTTTRIMDDDWIYLGCFDGEDTSRIDFLHLRGFKTVARWHIDSNGKYIGQEQFDISAIGPLMPKVKYKHTNAARNVIDASLRHANDFQIYSVVKYILGDAVSANEFMNAYAPEEVSGNERVADDSAVNIFANFIFNHNYARNIKKIDSAYSERFAKIQFVLPNACPSSSRCFYFPAG